MYIEPYIKYRELFDNFGLFDLEACFADAYEALPKAYKDDPYIKFHIDEYGSLCANRGLNKKYIYIDNGWLELE